VIITFTEGSATDFVGRTISEKLSEIWGQPVTVENQAGAGGTIGANVVAKAAPDGYTLLVHSSGFAVNPSLYTSLPYQPSKDFKAIALLARQPLALVVGSSAEAETTSDIIAAARNKPGEIKFGSPGTGSAAHLVAEKFVSETGTKMVHVPFKGGPETVASTSNGDVLFSFLPVSLALKGVNSGKLRALGVTSSERTSAMPDVPTIAEAGLPGFESSIWWGIWAPAGLPQNVADKLEKDISLALASPDVLDKFNKRAFEPMELSQGEFSDFVDKEMADVASLVKEAGIQPE